MNRKSDEEIPRTLGEWFKTQGNMPSMSPHPSFLCCRENMTAEITTENLDKKVMLGGRVT